VPVHLWNFRPSRASLCGQALFTHRITGNPGQVSCWACYKAHLLTLPAPPVHPR
jgi:hypothetical protein